MFHNVMAPLQVLFSFFIPLLPFTSFQGIVYDWCNASTATSSGEGGIIVSGDYIIKKNRYI
jgi:hypothetical protein